MGGGGEGVPANPGAIPGRFRVVPGRFLDLHTPESKLCFFHPPFAALRY